MIRLSLNVSSINSIVSIGALLIPVYCGGSGRFSVGGVGAGLLITGLAATGAGDGEV
jgi:TM2 domain-containing membrane protein YozV